MEKKYEVQVYVNGHGWIPIDGGIFYSLSLARSRAGKSEDSRVIEIRRTVI